MTSIRLRPMIALVVAAAAVAAGATGITYAATAAAPQVVYGCVNSHGVLRLLTNGHCSAGYAKVGINRSGVRGAPGLKGLPGAAGAGARFIAVSSTTSTEAVASVPIAALDLQVRTLCNVGGLPSTSDVYLEDTGGTTDLTVTGSVVVQSAGGGASIAYQGTQDFFSDGLSAVEFTRPGDSPYSIELTGDGPGGKSVRISADLTVVRAGKTVIVRAYVDQNPTKCRSQAAVIPAS